MNTRKNILLFMIATTVAIAVAPALANAKARTSEIIHRFAFIAGSNDGGPRRVPLRYAHTDAKAIARVLRQLGGVASRDTVVLLEPDRFDFEAGLARMRTRLENSQASGIRLELVIYYSGHSDEQGLMLGEDLITYRELRAEIADLPADVRIAILDSCSSGALTRGKGGTRRAPFLVDTSVNVKGYAYLTSSSADEAAQESDRVGGSFFTHYLVSGLRGAADASQDGKVTLNEAYQYAFDETLARTESTQAGPQHPNYDFQLKGSGDLVLTDLRGTSALLVLPGEFDGRFFIRNRKGQLVAEINKSAGKPVTVGLEPGVYEVTSEGGHGLKKGRIAVGTGSQTLLASNQLAAVSPEATVARGDQPEQRSLDEELEGEAAGVGQEISTAAEKVREDFAAAAEKIRFEVARLGTASAEQAPAKKTAGQEEIVHRPFSVSFVPGLTTDRGIIAKTRNNFSLNFIGWGDYLRGAEFGWPGNIRKEDVFGFQGAGFFNFTKGTVRGVQGAGIFNFTGSSFLGFQGSGIANVVHGPSKGVQFAGISNANTNGSAMGFQGAGISNFNRAGSYGFQGAGIVNVNGGDSWGFQGAGISNFNRGHMKGFQGAGIVNINGGNFTGFQGAGIANASANGFSKGFQGAGIGNFADSFRGAQMSGISNVAYGKLHGFQGGLTNYAGEVHGVQLGLVNIAREHHGAPIGLINAIGNGMLAFSLWGSDTSVANFGLKMGSRHFYSILGYGVYPMGGKDERRDSLISGLGGHFDFNPIWLELDLAYHWNHANFNWAAGNQDDISKFRITVGWRVAEQLSLFAGPTLNFMVSEKRDHAGPIPALWSSDNDNDLNLSLGLGFIAGLQFEPRWGNLNTRGD